MHSICIIKIHIPNRLSKVGAALVNTISSYNKILASCMAKGKVACEKEIGVRGRIQS